MRPESRRAALLAALKTTRSVCDSRAALKSAVLRSSVALGLSGALLGCYDMHGAPPGTDAASTPDVALVDAPPADVPPDAPVRLDVGELPCGELLPSLAITEGEGGWGAQFTSEVARLDPTVGACCHEIELAVRAGARPVEPFTPLAFACCDVVVFQQGLEPYSELGCTPWGPPCPPEMPVV